MTRRICVVTGSRADYGHLSPLLRLLRDDADVTLRLVACGMHLSPRYGETWRAIEEDGNAISARVELLPADDSPLATARAVGAGVSALAEAFESLQPDIVVVLGDRFEMLAAGQAALLLGIPLAHIHGGELTEGAMDDAIRHALTKMAQLHFVAAAPYARRVIQMGEAPERVFLIGAPGLDHLGVTDFLERDELARAIGLNLEGGLFLVTYHPVTLRPAQEAGGIAALLEALADFPKRAVLFTGVNADPGNSAIDRAIADFVTANSKRSKLVASLGQRVYLSALRQAEAVIGNSSSGLVEAPALGVPTINVGARQDGRLRAASVVDCPEEPAAIRAAVRRATSAEFRAAAAAAEPPYGRGGASARIAEVLKGVPLERLILKRFHDLPRGGAVE